jgi:hypothetical protein
VTLLPAWLSVLLCVRPVLAAPQGGEATPGPRGSIVVEIPATLDQPDAITVFDAAGNVLAGRNVQAVEAPGTVVERRLAVGTTDASGRSAWTPRRAGWVRLEAGPVPLLVYVKTSRLPPLAALLAFLIWGALPAGLGARFLKSRG